MTGYENWAWMNIHHHYFKSSCRIVQLHEVSLFIILFGKRAKFSLFIFYLIKESLKSLRSCLP